MSEVDRTWKVGELARATGVSIRALHHYDEIALLVPGRTESRHRVYSRVDVERLYRVLALRAVGLPLGEIRSALDDDGVSLTDTVRRHVAAVERDIEYRRRLLDRLRSMLDALERSTAPTVEDLIGAVEAMTVVEARIEDVLTRRRWDAAWELTEQHVVLLREADGERVLPIWIGQPEAAGLVHQRDGAKLSRPMGHDLMRAEHAAHRSRLAAGSPALQSLCRHRPPAGEQFATESHDGAFDADWSETGREAPKPGLDEPLGRAGRRHGSSRPREPDHGAQARLAFMSELGRLLELLHGAVHSHRSARATLRRRTRILRGPVAAPIGDPRASTARSSGERVTREGQVETASWLWLVRPDLVRYERVLAREGESERVVIVGAGDRRSCRAPGVGIRSERDPLAPVDLPELHLLDPWELAGGLEFEVVGDTRCAGRPAIEARATSRDFQLRDRCRLFRSGGEDYLIEVDAERGVILKLAALAGGRAIETIEITEIFFDEELDARLFELDGPSAPRAATDQRRQAPLRCSFCLKSPGQVVKLVAGPGSYICSECVELCSAIITEQEAAG